MKLSLKKAADLWHQTGLDLESGLAQDHPFAKFVTSQSIVGFEDEDLITFAFTASWYARQADAEFNLAQNSLKKAAKIIQSFAEEDRLPGQFASRFYNGQGIFLASHCRWEPAREAYEKADNWEKNPQRKAVIALNRVRLALATGEYQKIFEQVSKVVPKADKLTSVAVHKLVLTKVRILTHLGYPTKASEQMRAFRGNVSPEVALETKYLGLICRFRPKCRQWRKSPQRSYRHGGVGRFHFNWNECFSVSERGEGSHLEHR